jgi:hypothetical protein
VAVKLHQQPDAQIVIRPGPPRGPFAQRFAGSFALPRARQETGRAHRIARADGENRGPFRQESGETPGERLAPSDADTVRPGVTDREQKNNRNSAVHAVKAVCADTPSCSDLRVPERLGLAARYSHSIVLGGFELMS